MPTIIEQQFEDKLEVFRKDVESATQFLYAFLAVHATAGNQKEVVRLLNTAPLFWNTMLGALQKSTFIALGRIFDADGRHNLNKLLSYAEENDEMFSKNALGLRKQGSDPVPPVWVQEYLRDAYVPTTGDFQRLRKHEGKWRQIYLNKYRNLRSQVFAHNVVTDSVKVAALFADTNIQELQRMLVFLRALLEALLGLYHNGRRPLLRPQRYSVKAMLNSSSEINNSHGVQGRIVSEAKHFLMAAVDVASPSSPPDLIRGSMRANGNPRKVR